MDDVALIPCNTSEERDALIDASPSYYAKSYTDELHNCLQFCRKSFLIDTAPVHNAGVNTGELRWVATQAGALTQRAGTFRFDTPMHGAPTVTTYNPSAANAEAPRLECRR